MSELVTTGVWRVDASKEADFVREWAKFAAWASSMPGAGTLRLGRDVGDRGRFVSFAAWRHAESAHSWKSSLQFRERMARVLQYVDDFRPAELDVVAAATGGTAADQETASSAAR